ncbi:MAG: carboxymuconolactone decarboxylase family protein [Acidobacteria bacterium]|nr:carboxymuconolactone decarboxylase family protein [Acidobacteriota bacterium]
MRKMMLAMGGLVIIVMAAMVGRADAQDRLPPIPAGQLTDAQKQAVADFKAARSVDISGPFVPLLRSPELMNRARAMGDYLRYKSALPPRLSEFVILLTARRWTQQYEWNAHEPLARQAGVRADVIAALAEGRRPAAMTENEDALFTLCDEIARTQAVGDATYARAVASVGEQGVVDAMGISGYYTMLAMVLNTARTPLPPGVTPGLKPLR